MAKVIQKVSGKAVGMVSQTEVSIPQTEVDIARSGQDDRMSGTSIEEDDLLDTVNFSSSLTGIVATGLMENNGVNGEQMVLDARMEEKNEMELAGSSFGMDGGSHELEDSDAVKVNLGTGDPVQEETLLKKKGKVVVGETRRKAKGGLILKGVSTKKRNVQRLTTPRKRPTPKSEEKKEDGEDPKDRDLEKELPGEGKPPKPSGDK